MFRRMKLKTRLIGSFLIISLIVFVVALLGWSSTWQLSKHIYVLSDDTLPSVIGLWKINQGYTQIHLAERTLLNPRTSKEIRQTELQKIEQDWEQINEGFRQYQATPKTSEESQLYDKFILNWNKWKKAHEEFLQLYQQFDKLGILKPGIVQVQLLKQGKENSPEMAAAQAASEVFDQVNLQAERKKDPAFISTQNSLLAILKANEKTGLAAREKAELDVVEAKFWVVFGMIMGTFVAIILGIIFSNYITKPVKKVINAIASFSAQIAATVEQQERAAINQAASVREITTTIDEFGTSAQQAAEQAKEADAAAKQALILTKEGSLAVEKTLECMASLQEKVSAIAQSISQLQQHASQIRNISNTVTDLANQTNMLALNAAVEAVRAGEHSRGFGVVAEEIRRLADRSKKSAERINSLVGDIQIATNSTAKATDDGTKTVTEGVKITRNTANAFSGVAKAIEQVVLNNRQISLTANQQAVAIVQVVNAMNAINAATQETTSGIIQTKIGTQKLNEAAQNLKALGVG